MFLEDESHETFSPTRKRARSFVLPAIKRNESQSSTTSQLHENDTQHEIMTQTVVPVKFCPKFKSRKTLGYSSAKTGQQKSLESTTTSQRMDYERNDKDSLVSDVPVVESTTSEFHGGLIENHSLCQNPGSSSPTTPAEYEESEMKDMVSNEPESVADDRPTSEDHFRNQITTALRQNTVNLEKSPEKEPELEEGRVMMPGVADHTPSFMCAREHPSLEPPTVNHLDSKSAEAVVDGAGEFDHCLITQVMVEHNLKAGAELKQNVDGRSNANGWCDDEDLHHEEDRAIASEKMNVGLGCNPVETVKSEGVVSKSCVQLVVSEAEELDSFVDVSDSQLVNIYEFAG